jgi:PKD repeat protein
MVIEPKKIEGVRLLNIKSITGLIIISLLFLGNLQNNFITFSPIEITSAESGAPPDNGTTATTWLIETGDNINRSHEVLITEDIVIQEQGIMNWYNITATANDLVDITPNGTFNITDSQLNFTSGLNCNGTLTLESVIANITGDIIVRSPGIMYVYNSTLNITGNQTIKGKLNLINSTLIINCSSQGEFFISVESGGELYCGNGTKISGYNRALSVKVLFIYSNSIFRAQDCEFRYIGYNTKFSGIKCEASNTIIKNCSFFNCFYAVSFVNNHQNEVRNCVFIGNDAGLNLSASNDNLIMNCSFESNDIGINFENANNNRIMDSSFINQTEIAIHMTSDSGNNTIKDAVMEDNFGYSIVFNDNSSNNRILNTTIQNTIGPGIYSALDSNNISIENSVLSGNEYHIYCYNNSKDIMLINCTLTSFGITEIYLDNSSELTTLNTTFDKGSVHISNGSNLTVQWHLHILTQNTSQAPLPETNLTIYDNENGSYKLKTKTDPTGWLKWLIVTEYYQTDQARVNLTPYNILATKFGYADNLTNFTVDTSKWVNITLTEILLFEPDLVPETLNFSIKYPLKNQTITITTIISNLGYAEFNNTLTNVTVDFYADGTLINRTINLSSLNIGVSVELTFNWTINLGNGSHTIMVAVDPGSNITEVNPFNNNLSSRLLVNSIPIAKLETSPSEALTFENIEFNANSSTKEVLEIPITAYFFDFGDGTDSGWIPENVTYHSYNDNGNYFVHVRVRDAAGLISVWSPLKGVIINNRPPLANFTFTPTSGRVTTEFTFDPSLSSDLDGSITKYRWEFSDGININNVTANRTFGDDIEYLVALIVWDDDNLQSERLIKRLKIQNTPPVATFIVTKQKANVSEELVFDGSDSSDIDDRLEQLEFIWDFGDETYGFNESIIKHNFSEPGIYTVVLFVKDDDGNTGRHQMEINVTKAATTPLDQEDGLETIWAIVAAIIILVIFFLLILYIFVIQSRKLRRLAGAEGEVPEFTTVGKVDFVILKKSLGRRYIKFELHRTTNSPKDYVGIIWKSAFLDSSWQVMESTLDSKEKVVDFMQLKVLSFKNKDWKVDYQGNGTILPKEYTKKPENGTGTASATASAGGVKLTKIKYEDVKPETEVEPDVGEEPEKDDVKEVEEEKDIVGDEEISSEVGVDDVDLDEDEI